MARVLWTKHLEGLSPEPKTTRTRKRAQKVKVTSRRPHHHIRFEGPDEDIPQVQVIPLAAAPKPRMSQSDAWKKRPSVLRYRAFCDAIRLMGAKLPRTYKLTFLIEMPASWTDSERAAKAGTPHEQKPDTSNLVKATEDACVADDSVLWRISADKVWAYNPAIIIEKVDPSIAPFVLELATQKTP